MKVYFAADHAGFELKQVLIPFVRDELGYEVEDLGAHEFDKKDDYPEYMAAAAKAVQQGPNSFAIIIGGSGQGEAMMANRFNGVRAAVYYGQGATQIDSDGNELDIIASTRAHNNANVLSLGARFLDEDDARRVVQIWLQTLFTGDERHVRRIMKMDTMHTT